MDNSLVQLFTIWMEQPDAPIIELLDINQKPVGALYLGNFREKGKMVISETNNQERYYFYCDGIGVYFSYYKKISK